MKLSKDSLVPLYLQVADYIQNKINDGSYKYGEKIDSESIMNKTLGVSVVTIRAGIASLVEQGILIKKHGKGTYVAMLTPFTKEGTFDEEGFRSNINYLIDQGVNGLVGAGTTGESATMDHKEHHKVIDVLVDEVDGRVETIAGTGSNSTSEALSLTKFAYDAGADAALLITPYYNNTIYCA